jgi:hypothetical protein
MTILFCGGELDDVTVGGTVTFNTGTTAAYRTTYARGTLDVAASGTFAANHARASFTASSSFSLTARVYPLTSISANNVFLWLSDAGSARLRLKATSSNPTTITLEKYNGTTATTLATSSSTITGSTQYRLDVIVDYQVSGRVRVYVDGTLYIDYSGDVTAASSTTLDSLNLGPLAAATNAGRWSEVIVCTQDSRTLSLVTLSPNAAGTANAWTGTYPDVDDTTASDTDVLTSNTAGQIANFNTTGMPSGWSNLSVTAVKMVASAARGSTGPTKLALGVRTNSTDSFPTATSLDTGFSTPVTTYYETNPVTGVAWTTAEIDALQIALKSEA